MAADETREEAARRLLGLRSVEVSGSAGSFEASVPDLPAQQALYEELKTLSVYTGSSAAYYINQRQKRTGTDERVFKKLLSRDGFPDDVLFAYVPPAPGTYRTRENRALHFVVIHDFGSAHDRRQFKKGNLERRTITKPDGTSHELWVDKDSDSDGHNPVRFRGGVQELTSPKQVITYNKDKDEWVKGRLVSIHFLVSRKGDVIASVDLDDVANHAGVSGLDNNALSIGIEFEPLYGFKLNTGQAKDKFPTNIKARTGLGLSAKQELVAAVLFKKFEAIPEFLPVAGNRTVYVDGQEDAVKQAIKSQESGYYTHRLLNPRSALGNIEVRRTDVTNWGTQKDWDRVFALTDALTPFNYGLDVFRDPAESDGLTPFTTSTAVNQLSQLADGQFSITYVPLNTLDGKNRAIAAANKTRENLYLTRSDELSLEYADVHREARDTLKVSTELLRDPPEMADAVVYDSSRGVWVEDSDVGSD